MWLFLKKKIKRKSTMGAGENSNSSRGVDLKPKQEFDLTNKHTWYSTLHETDSHTETAKGKLKFIPWRRSSQVCSSKQDSFHCTCVYAFPDQMRSSTSRSCCLINTSSVMLFSSKSSISDRPKLKCLKKPGR